MKNKLMTLYALIIFIYTFSAAANAEVRAQDWTQKIKCHGVASSIDLNLLISSQQFPIVSAEVVVSVPKVTDRSFHLSGHYMQSYDTSTGKQYYGFRFKFDDQNSDATNLLEIFIEDNKDVGYANLTDSDITGLGDATTLTCTVVL